MDHPPTSGALWRAQSRVDRVIGWIAIGGGFLALAVAVLVTASVLGRWLLGKPIEGDFEFVKMATAIAVFSFLPYTQIQRGNIMVDTFTHRLPVRGRAAIDALWDLTYAGVAVLMAHGLFTGAGEAMRSKESTMQLQILIWPAIGLCALLATVLVLSSLISAARLLRRRG
ncbi:MAG: TRAP transporter small permease [Rhizobiales bacterium]|nr:TRAP transporter small permease [Hyphomicrobiales bacterium]